MEKYLLIAIILITGMAFGIAVSFSIIAHPALLKIDTKSAIKVFVPLFRKTHITMISLSIVISIFGLLLSILTNNWRWLSITLLMHFNAPYTMIFMMPVNKRLTSPKIDVNSRQTHYDLKNWGKLHLIRTIWNGIIFLSIIILTISSYTC